MEGGTALIALRAGNDDDGHGRCSARVMPPISGAERGRSGKQRKEHREAEQAEDDRGHGGEVVDR